jgi:hypothetical protein
LEAGENGLFGTKVRKALSPGAKDVALWDISEMNQSILSSVSYQAISSETRTTNGRLTGYGLGFFVRGLAGIDGKQHLMLHHPGEISGFQSHNCYPI